MMVVDGAHLYGLLAEVRANNVNKERYLTDIVRFARDRGLGCAFVSGIEDELMGIDTRADLAIAEANIQTRLRAAARSTRARACFAVRAIGFSSITCRSCSRQARVTS